MSTTFYDSQIHPSAQSVCPEFLDEILDIFSTIIQKVGKMTADDVFFVVQKKAELEGRTTNCSAGQVKLACEQLVKQGKLGTDADTFYLLH